MNLKILFTLIVAFLSNKIYGAKILALTSLPSRSHFNSLEAILIELARNGHELTVVSGFRLNEKLANYTEIIIEPPYNFWDDVKSNFGVESVFDLSDMSVIQSFDMVNLMGYKTTEYALKNPGVQKLLHDTEQKFDLIFAEQFYQDALTMLAYKYQAPIVSLCTFGFENYQSNMMGLIVPWAQSPQGFLPYTDKMTFFERLRNCYNSLYAEYNRKFIYFPSQDELVKRFYSHLPGPLPSVADLEKNVSVLLYNNHLPLDISRPHVMGLVPIGGVHIKPPKILPKDIRDFLDDARNGAIYFSLGTNLKSSELPPEKLEAFLKVFSKLKERILWKWDQDVENLPKNVMIKKWLPQNDILAHPHVKLFITHGGLLSLQEAVYRSVPMLGIPIFGDQHINMKKVQDGGYGIALPYTNLTEVSLTWALQKLIYDPSYMINMREMSQIFRDRPASALQTSIYWINYVIRFKGAPHMKSAVVNMPWYTLYLLDIIAFLLSIVGIVFIILLLICKAFLKLRNRRKEENLYYKLK